MIGKKFKLLALIDDENYVKNEIYQSQLFEELETQCTVTCVSLAYINKPATDFLIEDFDGIFCTIKIRNTFKFLEKIALFLKDKPVIINDFDPWVNFLDNSPYKGIYQIINQKLNVKYFFVSANFWAQKLCSLGLPAVPMKIGMKQAFIKNTKPFFDKKRIVEFRGTKHVLRLAGHQKLAEAGLNVPWLNTIKPYNPAFLESINDLKVWCHNEGEPVIVDGKPLCFNALWPKAIEVLARGCFVLRDSQEEAFWYQMNEIPTVFLYDNPNDAKAKFDKIMSLSNDECDARIAEAIEWLQKQQYWPKYVNQLLESF